MQRTPTKTSYVSEQDFHIMSGKDDKQKLSNPKKKNKRTRGSDEDEAVTPTHKDEVMAALNKITMDVEQVKMQNNNIQETMHDMKKAMTFLSDQYEELQNTVKDMKKERTEHMQFIKALENKVEDLQRNIKSSAIEIRNIPANAIENQVDLVNLVRKTCRVLEIEIQQHDLKDVFKLNNKSGKTTIVADFTTTLMKNQVVKRAKEHSNQKDSVTLNTTSIGLNGPSVPIYLSEALTAKNKRLYYLSRDFAKTYKYKFCWTSYGKVYLRKIEGSSLIPVREESDLAILKEKLI